MKRKRYEELRSGEGISLQDIRHRICEQTAQIRRCPVGDLKGEEVALAIRDHQVAVGGWQYSCLARELHHWVEIFDSEFKLELFDYPVIRFAPLRNAYAGYMAERGDLGTKDNIIFNTNELPRDLPPLLATLCHELIHFWQRYHGRPARGNYHNAEFRRKAHACGLVVDDSGCHTGYTDTFTAVLAKYGLETGPLFDEQVVSQPRLHGATRRDLKMKKWSCGCTNVRCATKLEATCQRCGAMFRLVPAAAIS